MAGEKKKRIMGTKLNGLKDFKHVRSWGTGILIGLANPQG